MSLTSSTTYGLAAAVGCEYAAGTLIGGKYRLERLIGDGGMATVWQASYLQLDCPVAVKLLHPGIRDANTMARLLREARVEARFSHPSIVRVFDYGETERGEAYIVMELLEGSNLSELLELHGALPPIAAVGLVLPIIHAICAVHAAGVVHRDLKPHNIVIAQTGMQLRPTLLDFGIAKMCSEFNRKLTIEGDVLGSPAYMAPEQVRNTLDVDERADIWALCVLLYELISGFGPFDADNQYATLCAVIERNPPALTRAGCATLWPILKRGLAKDRELRIASAYELGAALARWLIEQGETEDACGDLLVRVWALAIDADQPMEGTRARVHELGIGEEPPHAEAKSRNAIWAPRRTLIQAACAFALAPALAALLSSREAPRKDTAMDTARPQPMAAATEPRMLTSTVAEALLQIAPAPSCESELEAPWTSTSTQSPKYASTGKARRAPAGKLAQRPASPEDLLGLKDPFR
jgi:serine/threonine protein kinase